MSELELLDRFRADVPVPESGQVERARTALAREIDSWGHIGVARSRPKVSRRVLLAAAAAAVVVPLGLSLVVPQGTFGGADPAAAAALSQAAAAARQQPAETPPQDGQYVYTRELERGTYRRTPADKDLSSYFFIKAFTQERWIGVDGSGRFTYTGEDVSFPTPQDRAAWIAAGSPKHQTNGSETYQPGELSYFDLSGLPSDPEALLEIIEQREIVGGPSGDWESFAIIGDLLRAQYAPPEVRAGLYELASQLSGVEYIGPVVDAGGRAGTAVGYTHNGSLDVLIFDPKTTELLWERTIIVDAEEAYVEPSPGSIIGGTGPVGTIAYEVAYLDRGVTESLSAEPKSDS